MKKEVFLILMFLFSLTFISAGTIPEREAAYLDQPYYFTQTCATCTYINYSIWTRDGAVITNQPMTYNGSGTWYGSFTPSTLQRFDVTGQGDINSLNDTFAFYFKSTTTGDTFDLPQAIAIMGQFGIIILLLVIGNSFRPEKWKLKSFFNLMSLLMGIIFLNTIRIISGTSANLQSMSNQALILGIIVGLVMFLYLGINYLIEVIKYFKKKNIDKFGVDNAY